MKERESNKERCRVERALGTSFQEVATFGNKFCKDTLTSGKLNDTHTRNAINVRERYIVQTNILGSVGLTYCGIL